MAQTSVLIVGLDPSPIDFSSPPYDASGLDAAAVRAGLMADQAQLNALGYEVELCLLDFGATAETVLRQGLSRKRYDCVMIGAGVRMMAENTPLFEKLVNLVHTDAPQAKFCFNTVPTGTSAAVQRCLPAVKQI